VILVCWEIKTWEVRFQVLSSFHANDKESSGYCMSFYTGIWLLVVAEMAACVLVSFSLVSFGLACEMREDLAVYCWFCWM